MRAAACLLVLVLVVATPSLVAATALSSPASGKGVSCPCHDVDPRSDFWKPFVEGVDQSCFDQAIKGGCGQAFFKSAIAEVGEYCQISCGSCPCCRNLLEVAAEGAGGAEFAWALNATDPAFRTTVAPLLQPGFMATVLVPPNDAMASVIRRLGGRAKIATDSAARAALASIVGAHILKPNADYNAAWTSPFLKRAPGQQLPTYSSDGVSLKVTAADGVVFTPIVGGGKEGAASARMASDGSGRVDLEACKGFVIGVDQVILPYALS